MTLTFTQASQSPDLTFAGLAAGGGESARQQIQAADPNTPSSDANFLTAFFRGVRLVTDGTAQTVIARVYPVAAGGATVYKASFNMTSETSLTNMLGDQAIDIFDGAWMTLETDVVGPETVVATPYVAYGNMVRAPT